MLLILPNRKGKECSRMLGKFQERTKFAGIIREVNAGYKENPGNRRKEQL